MKQQTRDLLERLIDALEEEDEVEVVGADVNEFISGDPTKNDVEPTGAEFDLTAFASYDNDAEDENPYRVK